MSTLKLKVKWEKMGKRDTVFEYDALMIQGVPVSYITNHGNWGYKVFFLDGNSVPKGRGNYYQKLNTAKRACEKRFGIII